jgi:hypothetical protein
MPPVFLPLSHDPSVVGDKPCIRGLRILPAYPLPEPPDSDEALGFAVSHNT